MATMSKAEMLVTKSRMQLVYNQPFYGLLAMQLELVGVPDSECPTMATDGFQILYGINHALTYPFRLLVSEIAHECGHNAYRHLIDRGKRDPELWNQAGDYRINGDLVEAGIPIGDDWLHDVRFNGKTTYQIYETLVRERRQGKNQQHKGGSSGQGQGKCCHGYVEPKKQPDKKSQGSGAGGKGQSGSDETPKGFGQHSEQETKNKIQVATIQAMIAAKAAGKLPGSFAKMLNKILYPPVPWEDETRHFLEECCKSDYSWKMPNARYMQSGFYLPTLHNIEHKPIVIGIDSSGSMTDIQLANALGICNDVLDQVRPPEIWVVVIDAQVHTVIKYEINDLPLKPITLKGRGGTRFAPFFEWIEKKQIELAGAIYITDMESYDLATLKEPDYPVLWASTNEDKQGPFGHTTYIPMTAR